MFCFSAHVLSVSPVGTIGGTLDRIRLALPSILFQATTSRPISADKTRKNAGSCGVRKKGRRPALRLQQATPAGCFIFSCIPGEFLFTGNTIYLCF